MTWRNLLARAPLPMLALAAAYGVYEFQREFVPSLVALISAAAFELTYLALAFVETQDRRRAQAVAVAAVVVSVLYNSLSALFHKAPGLLDAPDLWAVVALAVLHGAPLAVIAYNLSVLLMHEHPAHESAQSTHGETHYHLHLAQDVRTVRDFVRVRVEQMRTENPQLTDTAAALALGTSRDTIRRALEACAAPAQGMPDEEAV